MYVSTLNAAPREFLSIENLRLGEIDRSLHCNTCIDFYFLYRCIYIYLVIALKSSSYGFEGTTSSRRSPQIYRTGPFL